MIMTKKYRAGAATPNAAGNKCMEKHYDCIVPLTRHLVKLAITADLVLLLAALGSLNIPATIAGPAGAESAVRTVFQGGI